MARARGAAGRRRPAQRTACSLVRAVDPLYATTNPALVVREDPLGAALSDRVSTGTEPPHSADAGVSLTGDQAADGSEFRLFRVYVATDRDCVNVVFRALSSAAQRSRHA